jgi:hypothetical protein
VGNIIDIISEIIENALPHVDSLFIADDGSDDGTWDKIMGAKFSHPSKIEHVQQEPSPDDRSQRESLIAKIRERYRWEDTWVQVIEGDMMILDTDIPKALEEHAVHDLAMSWQMMNAVRLPGTWDKVDTWPNWTAPIKEIMGHGHWMEVMTYTYRPHPELYFCPNRWRPWPMGWSRIVQGQVKTTRRKSSSPLLAHYGYRGPTHFYHKYKGIPNRKHPDWDNSSMEAIEKTVPYFNGTWNGGAIEMSRKGYKKCRPMRD